MIGSVFTGAVAAAVVSAALYLQEFLAGNTLIPLLILAVTALVALWGWFGKIRRSYHGVPDMLVQIHSPSKPDRPAGWMLRGVVSFFLACLTGAIGPEGVAAEFDFAIATSTRPRSARWFEARRRTDAATSVAAGIAAAFGAPFAALLVPIELGIGGRPLSSVICVLVACLGMKFSADYFGIARFDLSGALDAVPFSSQSVWAVALAMLVVAVLGGLLAAGFNAFVGFSRRAITACSPRHLSGRVALAGAFLALIVWVHPLGAFSSRSLLQDLFLNQISSSQAGILFFEKALLLVLIVVGFGTAGIFWPVFALGGFFGFAVHDLLNAATQSVPQIFAPMTALGGAAVFFGAVLGTPISAAVLIYELTGQIEPAISCLLAAILANSIARRLSKALPEQELSAKGIWLIEGRSQTILESIRVRDVMVTDYETIHEQESVAHLPAKILASRYPFLPVVRGDDRYTGLVTIDMVQDRLAESHLEPAITDLFEVKDLLYRSGYKSKVVKSGDRLSAVQGAFQDIPCVPVLSDDGRIEGLLFVYHVRLAYEREMARQSLQLTTEPAKSPVF